MNALDSRLHAFRPDLADARLEGRVAATHYVAGTPARIVAPVADMLGEPRPDSAMNTQLLCGDDVMMFEEAEGWAWVQADRDGYVGYVSGEALGPRTGDATHMLAVPRSFLYPGPDLRLARQGELSLGSSVKVKDFAEARGTRYALLSGGGAVIAGHLRPAGDVSDDYVSVAETLLMTPYLWGGTSAFGIDCSGLVQLSMQMAGRAAPRDSDMQAAGLGDPVEPGADYSGLHRGDLVFWEGHVAIMRDEETIIHASGDTMMVSIEKLRDAVERIGHLYGGPTGFRRP